MGERNSPLRMGVGNLQDIRRRLNETGIGYAGIDGVWWLPAVEPFRLPAVVKAELAAIGRALFCLFDAVTALYESPGVEGQDVRQLLSARVPPGFTAHVAPGQVAWVRPDFQLAPQPDGRFRLVATELEICPSAQGYAHAMQAAYGLPTDLAEQVADWLDGRMLLIVGTHHWSEFLFEQLAFCRALAGYGAMGCVLYDRPLAGLAAEVQRGERWQPPIFGVEHKPAGWDADILSRINKHDFTPYLWPGDHHWPDEVGEQVIFRFGYVDTFAPEHFVLLRRWQVRGATFINPPTYFLDSKVVMAALALPAVRQRIGERDADALPILDRVLPETLLLEEHQVPRLRDEQDQWVLKFAGFDRGNRAWGGRSLRLGTDCSAQQWQAALAESLRLPWPVVAQRLTPTAQITLDYCDEQGEAHSYAGASRLRTFLLRPRHARGALVGGAHLTVSASGVAVAESTQAVQTPVYFAV
jgi:hypothetical protein